jgi:hypothetical protein
VQFWLSKTFQFLLQVAVDQTTETAEVGKNGTLSEAEQNGKNGCEPSESRPPSSGEFSVLIVENYYTKKSETSSTYPGTAWIMDMKSMTIFSELA